MAQPKTMRQPYHLRTLRRPPPEVAARFDDLIDRAQAAGPNAEIGYELDAPKADFLNYVCDWRDLVAHGSPLADLEKLVPRHDPNRDVNEFGRRDLTFASPDALWAMWFAMLPQGRSTANGCKRLVGESGTVQKRYFFSLPSEKFSDGQASLSDGVVYLCRGKEFPETNGEEWGSPRPVVPVARIRIEPQDFPFRQGIFGFDRLRMQELTGIRGMQGFPWFDDPELFPIRPAQIVVDGVPQLYSPS